jgi:hypothetical protein
VATADTVMTVPAIAAVKELGVVVRGLEVDVPDP